MSEPQEAEAVAPDPVTEEPTATPEAADPPAEPPTEDSDGYPAGTPVSEMSPEQAAAYWKAQARKHEGRAKDNHAELEKLRRDQMTEQERALTDAVDSARTEARREMVNEIVQARLEAAGVPADDIADLDLSKFVNQDLTVDADKVAATGARFKQRTPSVIGTADGGPQGGTPTPPSIDQQIAEAQQKGDAETLIRLNNLKLAELAGLA